MCLLLLLEVVHQLVVADMSSFPLTDVIISISYNGAVRSLCLCPTNTTASTLRFHVCFAYFIYLWCLHSFQFLNRT